MDEMKEGQERIVFIGESGTLSYGDMWIVNQRGLPSVVVAWGHLEIPDPEMRDRLREKMPKYQIRVTITEVPSPALAGK